MDADSYDHKDIQEFLDREAIRDVLFRYARGIDRCDEALLQSVYWPDSNDDHGDFTGSGPDFIAWVTSSIKGGLSGSLHLMGNILIRIEGRHAAVETYFHAFHRFENPSPGHAEDVVLGGRYADRMEKRGKEWRIAHRVVAFDYVREYADTGDWRTAKYFGENRATGSWTPNDPTDAIFGDLLKVAPFQN